MRLDHGTPHPPTYFSVCSGIGGLDLGLERVTGAVPLGYCERDSFAQAVLMARMEDERMVSAPVWDDVFAIPGGRLRGLVDFLVGGIPCQPHSRAGKQLRREDERDLVDGFVDLARDMGPKFILVENVAGFVARDGLGRLLGQLADLGFDAEWTSVRVSEVGAPHRRERVFVLAFMADSCREGLQGVEPHRVEVSDERVTRRGGGAEVADPEGVHVEGRSTGSREGEHRGGGVDLAKTFSDGVGLDTWPPGPSADWRGVPEWCWPSLAQPRVRGVADGVPTLLDHAMNHRTDRLRCLGNAVVPAQAEYAIRELLHRITH